MFPADVHDAVAPRPPARPCGRAPRPAPRPTSPPAAHPLERDRLLERDQPVEPLLDLGLVELTIHLGGARPRPGEYWNVYAWSKRAPNDVERVLEVLLGLAGEPHDDVRTHRDVRDRGPDPFEPAEVTLATVGTLHRPQHPVRPRLQREVDVLAHLVALCHRIDHIGREVVGCGLVNRIRRSPPPGSPLGAGRRTAGAGPTPAR